MRSLTRIGVMCMAIGVIWAGPVFGDAGLCNRLMTFVARARGDATKEFNRRIAFLFETGRIGEAELERMLGSEGVAGPFQPGQHIPGDLVPHHKAFERLRFEKDVTWPEVKEHIKKLLADMREKRRLREGHEKETEAVVYPVPLSEIKLKDRVFWMPLVFEEGGKRYAVVRTINDVFVYDLEKEKRVAKLPDLGTMKSNVAFHMFNGKAYVAFSNSVAEGRVTGRFYVFEAVRGKMVAEIVTEKENASTPAFVERDGKLYIVVGSGDHSIYVAEALGGDIVRKIETGASVIEGTDVFDIDGKSFFMVQARDGYLYVAEVADGGAIWKHRSAPTGPRPAWFKKSGTVYVVTQTSSGLIHVQLYDQDVDVARISTGKPVADVMQAFEEEGETYLAVRKQHSLSVYRALDGEEISHVEVKGELEGSQILLRQEGTTYVAIQERMGHVSVIEALSGKVVAGVDGTMRGPLGYFEHRKHPYLLVSVDGNRGGAISVISIPEGCEIARIKMPKQKPWAAPATWEDGRELFALAPAGDKTGFDGNDSLHVIQLVGLLPEQKENE